MWNWLHPIVGHTAFTVGCLAAQSYFFCGFRFISIYIVPTFPEGSICKTLVFRGRNEYLYPAAECRRGKKVRGAGRNRQLFRGVERKSAQDSRVALYRDQRDLLTLTPAQVHASTISCCSRERSLRLVWLFPPQLRFLPSG